MVRQELGKVFDHEIVKNGLTDDEVKEYQRGFNIAPFFRFF